MEEKSKEFLRDEGCCHSCIELFHGHKVYKETKEDNIKNGNDEPEELTDIESYQKSAKRVKFEICVVCLGLLQEGLSSAAIQKIADKVMEENHDASEFALYISLPISLQVRIASIWAQLLSYLPDLSIKTYRQTHLSSLKTLWRNYMGAQISTAIGKKFSPGQENCFRIDVSAAYSDDEEDCKILEKICSDKISIRRVQYRKYNGKLFTRQSVEQELESIDDPALLEVCPLRKPTKSLRIEGVTCNQAPLFFAGRYCKFSRKLPQTPWFVDGGRRFDTSVEELIVNPINKVVLADGIKFSSSGREDVDVRCLGNGRPFVLEFNNPRRTTFKPQEVLGLRKALNSTTDNVRVHDLQIVSRKDISHLKLGEEEKTKSYCAICIAKKGYDIEPLSKLREMKDLTVHQTTPVRVLHRRPLMVRDRVIRGMEAVPIDDHFFKLYCTTQAGTYIKEFVHGDFGRTVPNLRTLLNIPVDIIALDVENVQLDWPPVVNG